jgi:hypothetical protein
MSAEIKLPLKASAPTHSSETIEEADGDMVALVFVGRSETRESLIDRRDLIITAVNGYAALRDVVQGFVDVCNKQVRNAGKEGYWFDDVYNRCVAALANLPSPMQETSK